MLIYCNDAEYTVFKINYGKQLLYIPVNISSSIQTRHIVAKDDSDNRVIMDNKILANQIYMYSIYIIHQIKVYNSFNVIVSLNH